MSDEAVQDFSDEQTLIRRLRAGDETAFTALVTEYHAMMVRIARLYVADERVAEEVVQETWVAVLKGLDRFEGRSSLKTWIFTILANRARTRARREGRYVSLDDLMNGDEAAEPTVAPDRFSPADRDWHQEPDDWSALPEDRMLSKETLTVIQMAIEALPPNQREVIRLRDLEGWSAEEVCNVLNISDTNQRVLLHRARAKVRRALEVYLQPE